MYIGEKQHHSILPVSNPAHCLMLRMKKTIICNKHRFTDTVSCKIQNTKSDLRKLKYQNRNEKYKLIEAFFETHFSRESKFKLGNVVSPEQKCKIQTNLLFCVIGECFTSRPFFLIDQRQEGESVMHVMVPSRNFNRTRFMLIRVREKDGHKINFQI